MLHLETFRFAFGQEAEASYLNFSSLTNMLIQENCPMLCP